MPMRRIKHGLVLKTFLLCLVGLFLQACQTVDIQRVTKKNILAAGQSDVSNVLPSQSWQDSGIAVIKGKTYHLTTTGLWSFGPICGIADPVGKGNAALCDGAVGHVPTASNVALVGKIGDQGAVFLVGHGLTLVPSVSGKLILGPNVWDWLPGDNSGKMTVEITRQMEQSETPVQKVTAVRPKPQIPPPYNPSKSAVFNVPRVALVIGNSAYKAAPLANPVNDARLMADTLRNLGFSVLYEENTTQRQMKQALNRFGDHLEEAGRDGVGLFYYAGHGVQVGGKNYLIPIDANIQHEKDVDLESVAADAALVAMDYAGNRLNVMILDACRNNPFKRSFRSANRGLALMNAPSGSLIAYATGPGSVAADGAGANSPYTAAVVKAMQNKDVAIERMFRNVRNQVMSQTNNLQVPWEASSLIGGDFFFNPTQ